MAIEASERWSPRTDSKKIRDAGTALREFDIIGATLQSQCYTAPLTRTDYPNPTGLVPVLNEVHPYDSRKKCDGLMVSTPGFNLFRLAASYSIPPAGGEHPGNEDNPLLQPMRWRWDRNSVTEYFDRDRDGHPYLNSNRQPFSQPSPRQMTQRVLVGTRYEAAYNEAVADEFENSVGSTSVVIPGVTTLAPGKWRLNLYAPMEEFTADAPYIKVQYVLEKREDGWTSRWRDEGTTGYDGTQEQPLYHASGREVTQPVLLNSGGTPIDFTSFRLGSPTGVIPPASRPALPPGATVEGSLELGAFFLRYPEYHDKDFALLGF